MAIKFTKKESINSNTDPILHTTLYGDIEKVNNIDYNKYTYFDSFEGYDLFINNDADTTVAIKSESLYENDETQDEKPKDVFKEIEKINSKYEFLDSVKYADSDKTIIIKAVQGNDSVLDQIEKDYADNSDYKCNRITSSVLFLDLINADIQLEDDGLLNHLDDNTIKDLASKTGTKLSGSESKDELKGIIKGALNNSK